jgi:hypothetical protein
VLCHADLLFAGKEETQYTRDGPGKPGGQSWTVDWLKFNNTYFTVRQTHLSLALFLISIARVYCSYLSLSACDVGLACAPT